MTISVQTEGKGVMAIDITGAASAANAGLGALANPEGVDVLILRSTLHIITPSDGAATLSVGVTTVAAAATDVLNALDVNGSGTDVWFNGHVMQNGAKTQISAPAVWADDKYLTFTGSATTAGFTGTLYVEYIRA